MRLPFRRGFAVAAGTGLLAVGLAACNADTYADTTGSEVATSDIIGGPAALDCGDLSDQVWQLAPASDIEFDDIPDEDLTALTDWMLDNGPDFADDTLAQAVSEWGALGRGYYRVDDATLPDEEIPNFETAAEDIDTACPGLGFDLP